MQPHKLLPIEPQPPHKLPQTEPLLPTLHKLPPLKLPQKELQWMLF
jgi:hypothetical protein